MILWSNFPEMIDDFENKVSIFNHIAEMNIITVANKLDITYDFHIKHNMHAVEWNINTMMNKNKNLIKKLDRRKCHPLIRKFRHVQFNN